MYNSSFIFQQDATQCHRSQKTIDYLNSHSIRRIKNWPAQSPDLSIIKNMLQILKEKIRCKNPQTLNEPECCK